MNDALTERKTLLAAGAAAGMAANIPGPRLPQSCSTVGIAVVQVSS